MIVAEVLSSLELIAPTHLAFDWDHVGLQVGSLQDQVTQGITCLDFTLDKAKLLPPSTVVIAHHPLIWDPLKDVRTDHATGAIVAELLRKDCVFIAAHTNWDAAKGGINDTLTSILGLSDVKTFGIASPRREVKLATYVPANAVEQVFEAATQAGAGVIGEYTLCSFRTPGTGTFLGSPNSNPQTGSPGEFEKVDEIRLEMVVSEHVLSKALEAVRKAHPYETPAIDVVQLHDGAGQPVGRIGMLSAPIPLDEFREQVDAKLETRSQVCGDPARMIQRVAVTGGAAGEGYRAAYRAGADVFITGEIKHHELVDASLKGIATIEAGHYATEHPGMESLCVRMQEALPKVPWECLASKEGENGRSW